MHRTWLIREVCKFGNTDHGVCLCISFRMGCHLLDAPGRDHWAVGFVACVSFLIDRSSSSHATSICEHFAIGFKYPSP